MVLYLKTPVSSFISTNRLLSAPLSLKFYLPESRNLDCGGFPKYGYDSMLNLFAWIDKVHKNGLVGVLLLAAAPWVWRMVEEHLKYTAGFNSNGIFSIIKSFQKFWVNQIVIILVVLL